MLAMWLLLGVSKNARKMILQPVSNIELSQTHTQLELDVHGVAGKLMKDVVHLWRENFEGKKNPIPKQGNVHFLIPKFLEVNP
jgi:hypothetical protein